MESQAPNFEVVIPYDVSFNDLNLQLDPVTGGVVFEYSPILKICEASGIDPDDFAECCEERLGEFLISWYVEHRAQGGQSDHIADSLIEEMELMKQAGQFYNYPAGHA